MVKVTYEVKKSSMFSWTLWKTVEIHRGKSGGISTSPVYHGTRKECLEEKKRLEAIERESRRKN